MITDFDYNAAVKLCEEIAARVGAPRFYLERRREVDRSRSSLEKHPVVRYCMTIIADNDTPYGHGFSHARAVAVDAGAIILIESNDGTERKTMDEMMHRAHIAGILHDIKRSHADHAREGARAADTILKDLGMAQRERRAITRAIGNHEAFKPVRSLDDPHEQLLSDALYDADKFRWGPDNFTSMLWNIIIPRNIPLSKVMERFPDGLAGIRKIRTTFRSRTGMEYGPDFIDKGLRIGELFYGEMKKRLGLSEHGGE
ncbi:MAG: hypothetical protein JW736_00890 [Deltaproteobacteria bacterium]|nr:hypothetical protein [Deltaproteobacteria bacterium]MBN2687490.1 hypothetical protein [Deltaproteobacteria bacterium]